MPQVILVDEDDHPLGVMEKQQAHLQGVLHRAFSVFLLDEDKLLLQQRAMEKYHCGGLWSNTCCSHPMPGEGVMEAARRRLWEELSIPQVELEPLYTFQYRAEFDNGLTEHELDHVLLGHYHGPLRPDPTEIAQVRWISCSELEREMEAHPQRYTPWFRLSLPRVLALAHLHP